MTGPVSSVEWTEPPPMRTERPAMRTERPATKWSRIAADLQTNPGEWAIIDRRPDAHSASAAAHSIRMGVLKNMPRGEFEAAARKVDGEYRVYARYVGGAS